MIGNDFFSICQNITLAQFGSTCTPQCPPESAFKQCLDGLVLSPWVTISFIASNIDGCTETYGCPDGINEGVNNQNQCYDATCAPCGMTSCGTSQTSQAGTTITVGNISSPDGTPIPLISNGNWIKGNDPSSPYWKTDGTDKCSSAIKAFQYSFDNNGGATCKITISDEKGSSFELWVNKMTRNIECARQSYKMKVEFGWIALNPDDEAGNGCNSDFATDSDSPCNVNCKPSPPTCGTSSCNPASRPCGARITARSGPLYFLPRNVDVNLQNGKFVYEITGVDLMQTANEQKYPGCFPDSSQTKTEWRFTKAVKSLCATATPSLDINLLRISPCGGQPEPMEFWVPPGQNHVRTIRTRTNAPCRDGPPTGPTDTRPVCKYAQDATEQMYSPTEGPLDQWKGLNLSLYQVLKSWIRNVRANDGSCEGQRHGKGILMNWDNRCPTPRLLMWADPNPTCAEGAELLTGRCIGTYIVGSKCSPVISFKPNMKWIFNSAMKSGGNITPANAAATNLNNSANGGMESPTPCNVSGGRGIRLEPTVGNGEIMRSGPANAAQIAVGNAQVHERTTGMQGLLPIEAELEVQGDPTIGSVLESIGKTVGIIVLNPFYIRDDSDDDTQTPGCPGWDTITESVVNPTLTNKNWFIRGVDHQIREGRYVTTYKVFLPAPGSDIGADVPLGGGGRRLQPQGTFSAPGQTPNGCACNDAMANDPGDGWLCCDPLNDPSGCVVSSLPTCPPPPCNTAGC